MAEEVVSVINIKTDNAVKTIGELRDEVKALRKNLDEQAVGSEAAEKALADLTAAQKTLRDATKLQTKEVEAAEGSYNALAKEMSRLKKEWKETGDEMKRADLGKQIQEINDELKSMDASIGNYQRNVGNYKESFIGALTAIPGPAGAATKGVMGLSTAMKALIANPVGAVIAAIGAALAVVVKALKTSQENFMAVKEAMSIFNGVGQGVTNMLQWLGKGLANAATGLSNLLDKLGLLSDRAKENQAITKEENQLIKDRMQFETTIKERELEISELRAKSADKTKYAAQERLEFLKQAVALEEKNATEAYEIAEREYKVLERKAQLTGNSIEDNQALNDAKIKMLDAEINLNNKMREYNAQITEATNQMRNELKPAVEEVVEAFNPQKQEKVGENEGGSTQTVGISIIPDEDYLNSELGRLSNFLLRVNNLTWEEHQREIEQEKAAKEEKLRIWNEYTSGMSGVIGGIADLYESAGEETEKSTKVVKALRIAEATINTISGAVSAYMAAPVPMSLAIARAAAVTATGMAQIAKIKSTNVSRSISTAPVSSGVGAMVSAPAVIQQVPVTRSLTSATEEERLNKIANDQRVYLVYSDVEQAGRQVSVQQAESSF